MNEEVVCESVLSLIMVDTLRKCPWKYQPPGDLLQNRTDLRGVAHGIAFKESITKVLKLSDSLI